MFVLFHSFEWDLAIELKYVLINRVHNFLFLTLIETVVNVFLKSLIGCALIEGTRKLSLKYA